MISQGNEYRDIDKSVYGCIYIVWDILIASSSEKN
jgi:hypothetical protein